MRNNLVPAEPNRRRSRSRDAADRPVCGWLAERREVGSGNRQARAKRNAQVCPSAAAVRMLPMRPLSTAPQQVIAVDATVEQFVATWQDLKHNPAQFTAVDLLGEREAETGGRFAPPASRRQAEANSPATTGKRSQMGC